MPQAPQSSHYNRAESDIQLAIPPMHSVCGILILDEPMNGLDVDDIRKCLMEFRNQGKTILIASHYAEDIEILCDTVHEIKKDI